MRKAKNKITAKGIVSDLVDLQIKVEKLPPLPDVEQAKLDQSIAIDQLYYSSKLEGTNLTNTMIENAIHGEGASATKE